MGGPTTLTYRHEIELVPAAPFHFDATFHKPDHFPSPDNEWQPGTRWQTMLWQTRPLGLKFENRGTVDRPRVRLSVWSTEPLAEGFLRGLAAEIDYRCSLSLDLSGFYSRFDADPELGPVLARWRGMRPLNQSSLYEYLLITIVLQNATVRRSVQMMRTLLEHHGTLLSYDGKELCCCWHPDDLAGTTEDQLRALKIGYRAKSIARVTAAFARREVDEFDLRARSRDEQRRALLRLYGIGPASAGYILFDVFHHLDELDYISPWECKIYSRLFFGREPEDPAPAAELLAFFAGRYGGYRMLAVHYFWEDLFWQRKTGSAEWLEKLIRL